MEKIRLGILGIGNMGTSHVKNVAIKGKCPKIELVAVADSNPDRLAWAEENVPDVQRFSSAEEMLDKGGLDAMLVAVPHYFHPKYAMEAMARGVHVMVEKPAGVYTKQVREMNEFAAKSGVTFAMMFNQRTNPLYIKMHELMASGELGNLRRANWIITDWYRPQEYYDSGAWRATWSGEGGGVLMNQSPHQLDLWQWICGLPQTVEAKLRFGAWHDIEVEDDVTAFMQYENGATGVFITTTGDCPGSNRFEITCDRGTMIAEGKKLTITRLATPLSEFTGKEQGAFSKPEKTVEEIVFEDKGPAHPGVLNAFADHILTGAPLVAPGEEGIRGLTLSNAMHLSAFLGKPVTLPLDEELYYNELMKRVKTSRRKENVSTKVSDTSGTY
ncbi:MAG: Gfo/Idh/MocA family oxidoreductase [Oscillospiraceae bacterium]|nr:Gfo/Idh/MocA family oxidoreductase [Oscillospiraceae bacterium]